MEAIKEVGSALRILRRNFERSRILIAEMDLRPMYRVRDHRRYWPNAAECFEEYGRRLRRPAAAQPVSHGKDAQLGQEFSPLSGDEHARTHIQAQAGEVDPPDDVFERFSADPPGRKCLQPRLS